ncbi:MAG: formate dehydrogenase accessory sulfurtransferase FdhD [Gammaproteobacteria bacterium]|nr:formate dehydrogenase accessory sulfurtransferase FdhD [Gammaproteobacteria bacterium]
MSLAIARVATTGRDIEDDIVAVEEPLEIRLVHPQLAERGQSISITMRTPGHDAELALGFLYSEAIVQQAADIDHVDSCDNDSNVVIVHLRAAARVDIERLRRHFYTTSSCGVCGKQSIAALQTVCSHSPASDPTQFAATMLSTLGSRLRDQQPGFAMTGGIHAAAVFARNGNLLHVAEDVGRHNAVDKVVGRLLLQAELPAAGRGLLVSGRASFELVQKAVRAGMPLLAAVGAPSSLAVELADEFGMTLVGFLRQDRFNIYTRAERIV